MPEAPNLPSPIDFFAHLKWLDGKPLLDTIEPYRRELFMRALHEFNKDGTPRFNLVLAGRAKKNWKISRPDPRRPLQAPDLRGAARQRRVARCQR